MSPCSQGPIKPGCNRAVFKLLLRETNLLTKEATPIFEAFSSAPPATDEIEPPPERKRTSGRVSCDHPFLSRTLRFRDRGAQRRVKSTRHIGRHFRTAPPGDFKPTPSRRGRRRATFSHRKKFRDATRRAPRQRQNSHFRFALERHRHLQDASTSTPTEAHFDRTPFELRVAISAKIRRSQFPSTSQQTSKDLRAANAAPLRLPAEGGRLRRHHSACDQVVMVKNIIIVINIKFLSISTFDS